MHRWGAPPKKRFKHIHVRLGSAIHGSAQFWKVCPDPAVKLGSWSLQLPLIALKSIMRERYPLYQQSRYNTGHADRTPNP